MSLSNVIINLMKERTKNNLNIINIEILDLNQTAMIKLECMLYVESISDPSSEI